MLSSCKESNDAAAIFSLMLTTNWEYLWFYIMTPNSHHNIAMIVLGKWLRINPMDLSAALVDYKNQLLFRISKLSYKPWDVPPKPWYDQKNKSRV